MRTGIKIFTRYFHFHLNVWIFLLLLLASSLPNSRFIFHPYSVFAISLSLARYRLFAAQTRKLLCVCATQTNVNNRFQHEIVTPINFDTFTTISFENIKQWHTHTHQSFTNLHQRIIYLFISVLVFALKDFSNSSS